MKKIDALDRLHIDLMGASREVLAILVIAGLGYPLVRGVRPSNLEASGNSETPPQVLVSGGVLRPTVGFIVSEENGFHDFRAAIPSLRVDSSARLAIGELTVAGLANDGKNYEQGEIPKFYEGLQYSLWDATAEKLIVLKSQSIQDENPANPEFVGLTPEGGAQLQKGHNYRVIGYSGPDEDGQGGRTYSLGTFRFE